MALAVLFPLSVLRSIKASQFTNATDARYNAEAAIDMFHSIIVNPAIPPNGLPGSYIFDPLGYAVASNYTAAFANNFGNVAGTSFCNRALSRHRGERNRRLTLVL